MYEQACEDVNTVGTCDTDEYSFKAYLARWMAATMKLVPSTSSYILPKLQASAQAAAEQCDGGTDGTTCGFQWTDNSTYDDNTGLGQEMSALSVIQSMLISEAPELLTNDTGGTSTGDASAGDTSTSDSTGTVDTPVTTSDRAGAGILTAIVISGVLGGIGFMVMGS